MKIVVYVRDGLVRGVYSDNDDVDVEVCYVDKGTETYDSDEAEAYYKTKDLHEVY